MGCSPTVHRTSSRGFHIESTARLLIDVGSDEPFDCCTVADVTRRRAAGRPDGVPIDDFIEALDG